jgi:hypothetical protein
MTYVEGENRYRIVQKADPVRFKAIVESAQAQVNQRYHLYAELSRALTPAAKPQ